MQFSYEKKRVVGWTRVLVLQFLLWQTSLDNSFNFSKTHFITYKMKVLDQMMFLPPTVLVDLTHVLNILCKI